MDVIFPPEFLPDASILGGGNPTPTVYPTTPKVYPTTPKVLPKKNMYGNWNLQ